MSEHTKEMLEMLHGQVAEMCRFLDPNCYVPDSWSLRDLIQAERARLLEFAEGLVRVVDGGSIPSSLYDAASRVVSAAAPASQGGGGGQ